DPLTICQAAAIDSVPVILKDVSPERFRRSLARQQPGETLPEATPTLLTLPLAAGQFQFCMPLPPTLVPRPPLPFILHPKFGPAAVRTSHGPGELHRNGDPSRLFFYACKLILRQA